jgi:transposase
MEKLKRLCESLHRERPELWPNDWILRRVNAPAHKSLSVKQFLAQKLATLVEHPRYSPDLAPNELYFQK